MPLFLWFDLCNYVMDNNTCKILNMIDANKCKGLLANHVILMYTFFLPATQNSPFLQTLHVVAIMLHFEIFLNKTGIWLPLWSWTLSQPTRNQLIAQHIIWTLCLVKKICSTRILVTNLLTLQMHALPNCIFLCTHSSLSTNM